MKRSRRELSIDMVTDRVIFKNESIYAPPAWEKNVLLY